MTGIFRRSEVSGGTKVWVGNIRQGNGICVKCGGMFVKILNEEPEIEGEKYYKYVVRCQNCGGKVDGLIANQPPHGRWWQYFFGEWDRKRAVYCMRFRKLKLPCGFREGKITLTTLAFTMGLIRDGVWDGL